MESSFSLPFSPAIENYIMFQIAVVYPFKRSRLGKISSEFCTIEQKSRSPELFRSPRTARFESRSHSMTIGTRRRWMSCDSSSLWRACSAWDYFRNLTTRHGARRDVASAPRRQFTLLAGRENERAFSRGNNYRILKGIVLRYPPGSRVTVLYYFSSLIVPVVVITRSVVDAHPHTGYVLNDRPIFFLRRRNLLARPPSGLRGDAATWHTRNALRSP